MSNKNFKLHGGPLDGEEFMGDPETRTIGLPISETGGPCELNTACGHAIYGQGEADQAFRFLGIQPIKGREFRANFADGPAQGNRVVPLPAPALPSIRFPVLPDGNLFGGNGEPSAVAHYERRTVDDQPMYFFVGLVNDEVTMQHVTEQLNKLALTEAVNNFYSNPNDDIYSRKPIGEHPQVLIELEHRRANVDKLIAPLILETWRLGLDTLGSCQGNSTGSKSPRKAYIGFPITKHAEQFKSLVAASGVGCDLKMKKTGVAFQQPDGTRTEPRMIDSANVEFEHEDIGRIVQILNPKSAHSQ